MSLVLNKIPVIFLMAVIFIVAAFFIWPKPILAQSLSDSDGDGLSDQAELNLYFTDPHNFDTDGDNYNDYLEIYHGYSPHHQPPVKLSSLDSDNDGTPDSWEIRLGLNLMNPDSDADGYSDSTEILNGYNPLSVQPEKMEKSIRVDLAKQQLAYYFGRTELEKFLISGGLKSMPTPQGNFTVLNKVPVKTYGGPGFDFYYPNTKWNLHFTTRYWKYYIHGTYWHNDFGRPKSHGCVNVRYDQMERLYEFAAMGTKVEIS